MANMELIETKTVGAGGAAYIEFTGLNAYNSIYTDLYLLCSIRSNQPYTADNAFIQLNGSSSSFNWKNVYSTGSGAPPSQVGTDAQVAGLPGTSTTANSFGNQSFYIADFAGSNYKLINGEGSVGNASTRGDNWIWSTLWSNVAGIYSIKILPSAGLLIENSSISLYGIKKDPASPKATGGIVSQDASYWYHMFPFSSTFTPTSNITCDYLVIAGGGGGAASGAGAGGLRTTIGATTGGGGTIESAIPLTSGTAYTITVGAGGAGSANGQTTAGSNGGNSSIAGSGLTTITSVGGGAGTPGGANAVNGISGGSGSGGFVGGGGVGQTGLGGAGTPNQGYPGGNSSVGESSQSSTGSGGGAGGAGQVGTKLVGAVGGSGMSIPSVANATFTGVNGYYAGGGGSAIYDTGNLPGLGGVGGGGNAASNTIPGSSGAANTGGGGGGFYSSNYYTAAYRGGSGLVVIRYAK